MEKIIEEFKKIGCTCDCCDKFPTCMPNEIAIDFIKKAYRSGRKDERELIEKVRDGDSCECDNCCRMRKYFKNYNQK